MRSARLCGSLSHSSGPHRIAPIDSDVDEDIGEFRIARECARVGMARRLGDGRLLKLVRGTAVASASTFTGGTILNFLYVRRTSLCEEHRWQRPLPVVRRWRVHRVVN